MSDQTPNVVFYHQVQRAFEDVRDGKMLLREIKLLRHLNHENVRAYTNMHRFPSLRFLSESRSKCLKSAAKNFCVWLGSQVIPLLDILPPRSRSLFVDVYVYASH